MSKLSQNIEQVLGPDHKLMIDGHPDDYEYGWRDMTADLSAGKAVGANAPTWAVFRDGISAYEFDDSTMNEMWVVFHPNHDVIEGEKFYPHVHWAPNTTSTGVVRWGIEYTMAAGHDQAAFPTSTTVYVNHTISADKQYQHIISEVSDADAPTMPEVDSLIMIRLFRDAADAADTFPDPVFGLTMDLHYRAGKFSNKGKRPDFDVAD